MSNYRAERLGEDTPVSAEPVSLEIPRVIQCLQSSLDLLLKETDLLDSALQPVSLSASDKKDGGPKKPALQTPLGAALENYSDRIRDTAERINYMRSRLQI